MNRIIENKIYPDLFRIILNINLSGIGLLLSFNFLPPTFIHHFDFIIVL